MFRLDNLESNIYTTKGNFGHVRMGDLIAVMAINEAMRQHYGKEILFNMSECPIDVNSRYLMKYFPERVTDTPGPDWPYGGNVWAWWDFIHRIMQVTLKIKNIYKNQYDKKKAVVNPLMNAPYNADRNWNVLLVNKIVSALRDTGYDVVVVGEKRVVSEIPFTEENAKAISSVCGSIDDTTREIMTADVYVGGDTGITHFAATAGFAPKKLVAIYGNNSEHRHRKTFRHDIDALIDHTLKGTMPGLKPFLGVDFSPKPNEDKKMYYTIQSKINYEILENFLRSE